MASTASTQKLCERCGEKEAPALHLSDGTLLYQSRYCQDCLDTIAAEDEVEERQKRIDRLLSRAGGQPRMQGWTLDSHPNKEGAQKARAWLKGYQEGDRRNLILFGPVGVGKTGLAWPLVRALCQDGVEAAFANFRDLLNDIRDSYRTRQPVEMADRLEHVRVACLDDLGGERPTDWARDQLASLIEHRYQRQLPIIVTSNYTLDELTERLGHDDRVIGDRIVSRLCDDAFQVEVLGEDRRLHGG